VSLGAPEPLHDRHDLGGFDSGVASLDEWLRRRARANQISGATRTFVVSDGARVIAYFALASGAVDTVAATGRFRRNMPEPVPVAVLARMAVDRAYAGRGLGRALVRDCAQRVLAAAEVIRIRGLLVHAISDSAKAFYLVIGFDVSPLEPMTLMATLADLRAGLLDAAP
jgi:GNAT superfamily N-acetyltransferase